MVRTARCLPGLLLLAICFFSSVHLASADTTDEYSSALKELRRLYRQSKRWRATYALTPGQDGFQWFVPAGLLTNTTKTNCPQFPGYYFIQGRTYDQYDMIKSCSSSSTAALAAECAKTPYCQAFTTAGIMKYRIPPGELGTGNTAGCSLCLRESPTEQAQHSTLPLRLRQLLQLSKGQYNSWRSTNPQEARCAGIYIRKDGGFESWLLTRYDISDDEIQTLVPKANQAMKRTTLYQQVAVKGGGSGRRSVLLPKLTGNKMSLKSPLDAAGRQASPLGLRASRQ